MKRILLVLFTVSVLTLQSPGNNKDKHLITADKKQLLKEWKLESSTQVSEKESVISSSGFNDDKWTNAEVPTTVLRALVKAGIYPDPHFDLNDLRIPDASDELSKRLDLGKYSHLKDHPNAFKDPYWFRTTFRISQENKGKKFG